MSKSLNKQALKVVIEGTPAERTYLCSKDFSLFLSYYFTEYLKYPYADFHYEWFQDLKDLMNDDIRELALIAFRESAKTSFSKIFLVWLIVYNKRRYINVDSFSITNAERILFDVVFALQTNPKLLADFGELYNSKRDANEVTQKRVNNFITNNGVRVEAHSTGKSVRGRLHGNQRPDFLLLDDFETNDTKDSKAHTLGVIEHINEFKSGLDSQAKIIYLGNYITESGSVQTLIDRAKTDHRLRVRIVPVERDGKPTWESKYAMTDIEAQETGKVSLEDKKRQLGSLVYATEMLNQPIAPESQKFKKTMFKYVTREKVNSMNTRKFATIDTAMSKEAHSDKTGVVRNYVNVENFWHLSGKNYTVSPKGLIDLIFQLHDEGMEKIGIETTSYTQGIEPFFQEECRKRGKYPYVVQLKHGGVMKETRIESLVAPYEAGSIYHIEGECDEMEEQLLKFPLGLHDDIIDAEQYQKDIAEPPYRIQNIDDYIDDSVTFSEIGI
jgi:phage terminase large subunit-like protein